MYFDPLEIEAVKERVTLSHLFRQLGFELKGKPPKCLCPFHPEKTASCEVNDRKGLWTCFGCGDGGDHITLLQQVRGYNFQEALIFLGGAKPLTVEDRKRIEQKRAAIQQEEEQETSRQHRAAAQMWDALQPISGSHAAAYLAARGLQVTPDWTMDLRFSPALNYRGYADAETHETSLLGRFPAMVAAIRIGSEIIGLHRTYLDPALPAKLTPPGDKRRNKVKKITGEMRGGLIWLSEPRPRIAIGEGVETTRSWLVLMAEREPDAGAAAAVSLSNLAGRCTGTIPHRLKPGHRIPNGEPDMEHKWLSFPDTVRELVLLGDGDSDELMTKACLQAAGRRARALGAEVSVDFAEPGADFNDMLRWLAA